jgi:hypothetical protein
MERTKERPFMLVEGYDRAPTLLQMALHQPRTHADAEQFHDSELSPMKLPDTTTMIAAAAVIIQPAAARSSGT